MARSALAASGKGDGGAGERDKPSVARRNIARKYHRNGSRHDGARENSPRLFRTQVSRRAADRALDVAHARRGEDPHLIEANV